MGAPAVVSLFIIALFFPAVWAACLTSSPQTGLDGSVSGSIPSSDACSNIQITPTPAPDEIILYMQASSVPPAAGDTCAVSSDVGLNFVLGGFCFRGTAIYPFMLTVDYTTTITFSYALTTAGVGANIFWRAVRQRDGMITALSPATLGAGAAGQITVTAASWAANMYPVEATYSAFYFDNRTTPCTGTPSGTLYPFTGTATLSLTAPSTAGSYALCVTKDGQTFFTQSCGTCTLTVLGSASDSALTSINPSSTFANSVAIAMTISGLTYSASTRTAFAPSGQCNSIHYGMTSWPAPKGTLDEALTQPGTFALCYSLNAGATWVEQTALGTVLRVAGATSSSIVSLNPASVSPIATSVHVVGDLYLAPTSQVAFVRESVGTTVCNTTIDGTPFVLTCPAGMVITNIVFASYGNPGGTCGSFSNGGCSSPTAFSIVNSQCYHQNSCTMPVNSNQFAYISPCGGAVLKVQAICTGCGTGTRVNVATLNSADVTVTLTTPDSYLMCYNVGAGWVTQSVALVVAGATVNSITSIFPSAIGTGTLPMLTFTGIYPSPNTYVAFTTSATACTGLSGYTPVPSNPTRLGSSLAATQFTTRITYYLCYSVNATTSTNGLNGLYYHQAPQVRLFVATDVRGITIVNSYFNYGVNVAPNVGWINLDITDNAMTTIGFVTPAENCTTGGPFYRMNVFTTTQTVPLPLFPVTGQWKPCYSVGGGYTEMNITFTIVDASPFSLSGPPPIFFRDRNGFYNITGAIKTPNTQISLVYPARMFVTSANCNNGAYIGTPTARKLGLQSVPAITGAFASTTVTTATAPTLGVYSICYTVNGTVWYLQKNYNVTIVATAVNNSIGVFTPNVIGTTYNGPMSFTGLQPLNFSVINFVRSGGDCLNGPFRATLINGRMTASMSTLFPQAYDVLYACYSSDGNLPGVMQLSTLTVAYGHSEVITMINPTIAVVNLIGQFLFVGAPISNAMSTVRIGLAPFGTCATGPPTIQHVMDTTGPISVGNVTWTGLTEVCYSADNGTTWFPQVRVSLMVTADASSARLSPLVPSTIGPNTQPNIVFTAAFGNPFPVGALVAFAPASMCNDPTQRVGQTALGNSGDSIMLGAPITAFVTTQYQVCYQDSANAPNWAEQTIYGVSLTIAIAKINSLTSISPRAVGNNTTPTITFGGISPTPTTYVGYSLSNCATGTVVGLTPYLNVTSTVLGAALTRTGNYSVCYTTNTTTFAMQTLVRLLVVAANTTSVTAVSPTNIGDGTTPTLTLTGPVWTSTSRIGFVPCAATDCSGVVGPTDVDSQLKAAVTYDLTPGCFKLCYTVDWGVHWVLQTAPQLTVIGATPTTITAAFPPVIGAQGTPPDITFTGAIPTPNTVVAFTGLSGQCGDPGNFLAQAVLQSSITATLSAAIPSNAVNRNVYLCYSVNAGTPGETWVEQANTTIYVQEARPDVVTAVTPRQIAAQTPATLTVVGVQAAPGALIGFSDQHDCSDIIVSSSIAVSTTFSIASIADGGLYTLCFSSTSGAAWFSQSVQLSVLESSPTSIGSISPSYLGVNSLPTVAIDPVTNLASPTSKIAFAAVGNPCSGLRYGESLFPTDGTLTLQATIPMAGTFVTCYSVDGYQYQQQTSIGTVIVTVLAQTTSLMAFTPLVIGTNTMPMLMASLDYDTPTTYVAFAMPGQCVAGPQYGITRMNSIAPQQLGSPLTITGTYDLCLSVDGVNYVTQDYGQLTVTDGSSLSMTSIDPCAAGLGSSVHVTVTGQISLTSYVALSTDNCVTRLRTMPLSNSGFNLNTNGLVAATYTVCFTPNNITWSAQSLVTLKVVTASAGSVTSFSPNVFDVTVIPTITMVGAVPTPTTYIAIAPPNGCGVTMYAQTPYTVAGPVQLSSVVPANGAQSYVLCYSVNGPTNYVQQSSISIDVIAQCELATSCQQCRASKFCSFCTATNKCSAVFNSSTCAAADMILAPTGACPTLGSAAQLSGATDGGTNVTLTSTHFASASGYQCRWQFLSSILYTPGRVVSDTQLNCTSPPAAGTELQAVLSVLRDLVSYSPDTLPFYYYRCGAATTCPTCYTAATSECGFCLETSTCSVGGLCAGTWGGTSCPTVTSVNPSQGSFHGGFLMTVGGTLFIDSYNLQCVFTSVARALAAPIYVNVSSYESNMAVTCMAPVLDPTDTNNVALYYLGEPFTVESSTFLPLPDPVAAVVKSEDTTGVKAAIGVTTVIAILVIAALVAYYFYVRRKRLRASFEPPTLSKDVMDNLVFGSMRAVEFDSALMPGIDGICDLFLVPGHHLAAAMSDATQATEADAVAKAMITFYEYNHISVEALKAHVEREIYESVEATTLFRANSFATKLYKTYSKMVGLVYLRETIGYELNAALAVIGDSSLDIREESSEEKLNKFTLLTVCQKMFLAIVRSEPRVPEAFRAIFSHVQTCMAVRFPVHQSDLASIVAGSLTDMCERTVPAQNNVNSAKEDFLTARSLITTELSALHRLLRPMRTNLVAYQFHIESLSRHVGKMLREIEDLDGSLQPGSQAARRVLDTHKNERNSVAVGGFFFLRFLVPAITAPEAYNLNRLQPTLDQRSSLVMISKVLQNLSNNREFGGKEAHMIKLNEFILDNRTPMHKLFDKLATTRPGRPIESYNVPKDRLAAAKTILYAHLRRIYPNVVKKLAAPRKDLDQNGVAQRAEVLQKFQQFMEMMQEAESGNPGAAKLVQRSATAFRETAAGWTVTSPFSEGILSLQSRQNDALESLSTMTDDEVAPILPPRGTDEDLTNLQSIQVGEQPINFGDPSLASGVYPVDPNTPLFAQPSYLASTRGDLSSLSNPAFQGPEATTPMAGGPLTRIQA